MNPVLTAEEMRWCDDETINTYGVSGLQLMENAGRGVVNVIKQNTPEINSKHVLIICGKGNNGGDGFVAARLLLNEGCRITVLLLASPADLKGDAKKNFNILKKITSKFQAEIKIVNYKKGILTKFSDIDIIVDAIFGTGFNGKVRKPFLDVIEWVNNNRIAKVYAVDIPSGVNGTTGVVENCAVKADVTITFGSLKSGLVCNQGLEYVGKLEVADIGIPNFIIKDKSFKTYLVEHSDVRSILPRRSIHAHKYSVGKVFVIAGSKGLTGAAALCCTSAMRAGAGAVILGTPDSVYPILAKKLTEIMVYPLPSTSEGTLSLSAFDAIEEKIRWADILVIGPGLSQNRETQKLIIKVLMSTKKKILIDADGLNAISLFGANKLRSMRAQFILTPHVGEFGRMTGLSANEIERNRISVVRDMAKRINSTIVLKGVPTATASKDGDVYLNSTGNPGMATAGSGDVLSGIIAGLWGQGLGDEEAAWTGVYLHGLAGDIVANKIGSRSLMAYDLIEYLPEAFIEAESDLQK